MEDGDFLKNLQAEADELRQKNAQLNTSLSTASYQGQEDANLIVFQVDTGEMLGKIEHFLRGEFIATDPEGNEYWAKPKRKVLDDKGVIKTDKEGNELEEVDTDLVLFNDYGVNAIMSIIGNYIDKNTILSFYDEMRINEILADLGDEMANFIYCNYEKMGMDTEFKKTRFQLTVITILHSIESTYRRSLRGKTMEDLNSSRIFTQMDNLGGGRPGTQAKKKFNLFKPGTW